MPLDKFEKMARELVALRERMGSAVNELASLPETLQAVPLMFPTGHMKAWLDAVKAYDRNVFQRSVAMMNNRLVDRANAVGSASPQWPDLQEKTGGLT